MAIKHKPTDAVLVESIAGYGGKDEYEIAAKKLTEAGFIRLRSDVVDNGRLVGKEGERWELWYLPSPYSGKGPIADLRSTQEVSSWVMRNVGAGRVMEVGRTWGASAG